MPGKPPPRPFARISNDKDDRKKRWHYYQPTDVPRYKARRGYKQFSPIAAQTGVRVEVVAHIIDLYHREVLRELTQRGVVQVGELGRLRFKVRPSRFISSKFHGIYGWTYSTGHVVLCPSPALREQEKLLMDMWLAAYPQPPRDAPADYLAVPDLTIPDVVDDPR